MKRSPVFIGMMMYAGMVIGAGMYGLPYVISKVGYALGVVYILVLAAACLVLSFCYAEVVMRTASRHQPPGYVGKYLGKPWKIIYMVSFILGLNGVLTAYTLEAGVFLHAIFSSLIGGTPTFYSLIFLAVSALIIYLGIKLLSHVEMLLTVVLILGVVLFVFVSFTKIRLDYLWSFSPTDFLLPYGVILFSLMGDFSISDIAYLPGMDRRKLPRIILVGLGVPVALYLLFVAGIIGVSGPGTTEDALSGVRSVLGNGIIIGGGIIGILTIVTSFLPVGLVLKEFYSIDRKLQHVVAWALMVMVPFIIVVLELTTFLRLLNVIGSVFLGVNSFIMLRTYLKARTHGDRTPEVALRIPRALVYVVAALFLLGSCYGIAYNIPQLFR